MLTIESSTVWERFYILATEVERHGFIMMLTYANLRSEYTGIDYIPVKLDQAPKRHKNWWSFVKAAKLCDEANIDYTLYVKAQFEILTDYAHVFPNQLLGIGAMKRYTQYKELADETLYIKEQTQEYDEEYYEKMLSGMKQRTGLAEDILLQRGLNAGIFPEQFVRSKTNG